jgi:hypothetical protein
MCFFISAPRCGLLIFSMKKYKRFRGLYQQILYESQNGSMNAQERTIKSECLKVFNSDMLMVPHDVFGETYLVHNG